MRRGLALATDYAGKRRAFGKLLREHPLHAETLADLQAELDGAFVLVFHVIGLLGKEEVGEATPPESALLRILTPVVKLFTAKQAIKVSSEVLECFGGAGYIEDTGLPRLLRDVQVLSIWEGTTNVLSLDLLRALKEHSANPLWRDLDDRCSRITRPELASSVGFVKAAAVRLKTELETNLSDEARQAGARAFAFSVARTYAAVLLLEQAQWEMENKQAARTGPSAQRWSLSL
jgi:hypothetical protein